MNSSPSVKAAWEMVHKYQHLPLFGVEVVTPYAMNYIGLSGRELLQAHKVDETLIKDFGQSLASGKLGFGTHLAKGTPEEITEAAKELLREDVPSTAVVTAAGVQELMQLYSLGIDCSGFVFHVLNAAWLETGSNQELLDQLQWKDPQKKTVRRAGTAVFAVGSPITEWLDVQPFDLLMLSTKQGLPVHVGLILPGENGTWWVVQSSRSTVPMGVTSTELIVKDGQPQFKMPIGAGTPWEQFVVSGQLVRHRLV